MQPFRFIHAADLHLDAPLREIRLSGAHKEARTRIREATFAAFDKLIDTCISEKAEFLLVAGDVYNSADRSLLAQVKFREGMRRLEKAGITAYVVHGNHDPLDTWSAKIELPGSAVVFGGGSVESHVHEKNGSPCAVIHGISFPKRTVSVNLAEKLSKAAKKHAASAGSIPLDLGEIAAELFSIGLLHCSVGPHSDHETYAPCSLGDDLVPAGIDYWALGHVHTRGILHKGNPWVVYPGNTQGLHVNETGARGCYVVTVGADGTAQPEFTPLDDVRWYRIDIDISTHESYNDFENALNSALEKCSSHAEGRMSVVRLAITGSGPVHENIAKPGDRESLEKILADEGMSLDPPVVVNDVRFRTRYMPPEAIAERRMADDFTGDFLKLTESYRENPELLKSLEEPLKKLYNTLIRKKIFAESDIPDLRELIDEAEAVCLEALTGGGE